jgi:hypothetical protein
MQFQSTYARGFFRNLNNNQLNSTATDAVPINPDAFQVA